MFKISIIYFNAFGVKLIDNFLNINCVPDNDNCTETKIINTISCKKAEVTFKGRNWIAWYSPEIPLPYGPYKFSGLPGLIIKITDDKGDYDFELIKSLTNSKLKGKSINIRESRYTESVETTQPKLNQALKNADANAAAILASYGTTIIKGQEMIRQREKAENKKYENNFLSFEFFWQLIKSVFLWRIDFILNVLYFPFRRLTPICTCFFEDYNS